jgi:hypothetical protein
VLGYFGPTGVPGNPPPTLALTDLAKFLREAEECIDNGGRLIAGPDGGFGCYNEYEGVCYAIGEAD